MSARAAPGITPAMGGSVLAPAGDPGRPPARAPLRRWRACVSAKLVITPGPGFPLLLRLLIPCARRSGNFNNSQGNRDVRHATLLTWSAQSFKFVVRFAAFLGHERGSAREVARCGEPERIAARSFVHRCLAQAAQASWANRADRGPGRRGLRDLEAAHARRAVRASPAPDHRKQVPNPWIQALAP
jgi:hypothetical protein